MSPLAWWDAPLLAVCALVLVAFVRAERRWNRWHRRYLRVLVERNERAWEDIYWMLYRDVLAILCEALTVGRAEPDAMLGDLAPSERVEA